MSRQSPQTPPVARGLTSSSSSPAHKPPRSLTQSPRTNTNNSSPGPTPVVAPAAFHYRSSSHADSFVRRAQTDLPDEEYTGASTSSASSSPSMAAAAATTPGKAARRIAPATSASSPNSSTTSLVTSPTTPSTTPTHLQPADASAWEEDDSVAQCHTCSSRFTLFLRKHHCRQCGRIFCDNCSRGRRRLRHSAATGELARVCEGCERMLQLEEDSDRGINKQPPHAKPATPTSHQSGTDIMSAMSLSGDSADDSSSAGGRSPVASSAVDCAPLVASLLAEVECAERLRRVQERMRDEMDAMLRVLAAELTAGANSKRQTAEVEVAS